MTDRGEFIEARLREELDFGTINTEVAEAIRWITAFDATTSATSAIVRRLAAAWEHHPDHPTEEDPR